MAVPVFAQHFTQDINKPIQTRQGGGLTFSTNNLANEISVSLYDDGSPVTFSGTVSGAVIRSDGVTVAVESGTLSDNTASIVLPEACFAVEGPIIVNIIVSDSSEVSNVLLRAIYTVVSSETETAVDPGDIIPNIGTLIDNIETAVASVPADYSDLLDTIADTFSSSTAYAAGDYAWYDGTLYRFTAAHAAGSWSGTDASAVVLANDLADLKSRIAGITETQISTNLYDVAACSPQDGKSYWNGSLLTQANYATTGKIPVEAETQYIFYAGGKQVQYCEFFSGASGGTFIRRDTLNNAAFTTPENCTYVAIMLFAASHTTEEYNAAISAGQLNAGSTVLPYMPYGDVSYVPLDVIENGDEIEDFTDLIKSASASDVGKLVKVKTVSDGKVIEWEFWTPEIPIEIDDTLTQAGEAADAKATGDAIEAVSDKIDDVTEAIPSKNIYDASACGPENNKAYWNGSENANTNYANTGKIPVTAGKTYIFSAGDIRAQYVEFFSGDTGGTYNSRETIDGAAFTVPTGCTFVAIMFFAASHTTEQYEAAIAVAQLEEGTTVTPYMPYGSNIYFIPLDAVEDGDKLASISDVTAIQSQINLFDKALAVNGKYVGAGSAAGTIIANADYAYTGKIPVKPNTQYNFSRDPDSPMIMSTAWGEWGQDGSFLRSFVAGYNYLVPIKTSNDCYYITVNFSLTDHTEQNFNDTIDTMMLCEGTTPPATYFPYNAVPVVKSSNLDDAYNANRDCFRGKKWLATGTSISWYDGKTYQAGVNAGEICRGYIGNVARRKGLLVTNEGISGATLGDVSESSLINRYTTLDWAGSDIATIEFGVNDFGHAVAIGTAEDAAGTSTFAACLKTIIEYALAQNPKLCLVICTEPDVRGSTANSGGHYLYEYTDVTLAIAKQYRLPVCDWFYHSGINSVNKGDATKDWMTADGTHPNDAGHMRMGAMLNQVFDSLIC